MSLNEIGPSSRERLTTLAKSIGREEFAMNVLEIPDEKVLDMLADELAKLYDMRSLNEVTRYSGFMRSKPDPDSVPFNPTGAVAEFREDLRALFGKFKDELNNRKFIGGVAEVMVNWKSLLRSQMNESISLSDYNEDVEKAINVGIRVGSNFDVEDVMYYVHNNWMAGNLSAEEAMKKISKYISPMRENVAPNHDGKAAPYGSGYEAVKETLRFIKENNPEFTNEEIKAELKNIKELGSLLDEKAKSKLCKRGRDYIAARKRAGEKSSAYLSGRAVKVCKGQIKGAGGKRKKSYKGKK